MQLYFALLFNANLKGFVSGRLFQGKSKILCAPGINCYSCPGAIAACPLGSLQGSFSGNHSTIWYVCGILLLYSIMFGRMICGWFCPFGLIQELFYKIKTPKLKKSPVTRIFSYLKYVILVFFALIIPIMFAIRDLPLPAFCKYICPAGTIEGGLTLLANKVNSNYFSMLGPLFTWKFLLMVSIMVGCIFIFRLFCRFICPLGALYGLFNNISFFGIKLEKSKCVDCGKCVSVSKMDIRNVGGTECIQCGECIPSCPTGAISIKAGRITLKGPETGERNGKGKRRLAWLSALVLLLLVMVYANFPEKRPAEENQIASNETIPAGMEVGMRAPDFTAALYSGEGEIALNELRGKTVVLNFWATWCAPCVKELTHFEEIQTKYPEDVYVLALHSNLVTEDVGAYLKKTPYTFSFGLDKTGSIIESFGGSTMLPHTVVLDENGVIVYNAVGSVTEKDLEILIQKAKTK